MAEMHDAVVSADLPACLLIARVLATDPPGRPVRRATRSRQRLDEAAHREHICKRMRLALQVVRKPSSWNMEYNLYNLSQNRPCGTVLERDDSSVLSFGWKKSWRKSTLSDLEQTFTSSERTFVSFSGNLGG